MPKTIKFNLKFGDTSVRTVNDLQENFSVQDVMTCYSNGLLLKFLERRGYADYAENVRALSSKNLSDDAVFKELVSIFDIKMDNSNVNEYAELIRLHNEAQEKYKQQINDALKVEEVVHTYLERYTEIINTLIENKDDLGKIRALTSELLDKYPKLIDYNIIDLFFGLADAEAFYPIFYMLTQDYFREEWLNSEYTNAAGNGELITDRLGRIVNDITDDPSDYAWLMKSDKSKDKERKWEDVELDVKLYMIIKAPADADVRPFRNLHNELSGRDLSNKFIVMKGIEYRNNNDNWLYYVEV